MRTRRWETLDSVPTSEGLLELRRRGADEFLIALGARTLMNSGANRSEVALGTLACSALGPRAAPRILIGGLGMACTLRACLDVLPAQAEIVVVELNPDVIRWCQRGPLADLTSRATADPRVTVRCADVADAIRAAGLRGAERFDALILDLYEGPHPATPRDHPHYGQDALAAAHAALRARGVFAVWSEDPSAPFEKHLGRAGFAVRAERPGRGGRRHVVYVAQRS